MKHPLTLTLIAASALALSGCATVAEQACSAGTPLDGHTLTETCMMGQMDRAQINSELLTGASVAVVGLATAAVVMEATEPPPINTVIVQPAY